MVPQRVFHLRVEFFLHGVIALRRTKALAGFLKAPRNLRHGFNFGQGCRLAAMYCQKRLNHMHRNHFAISGKAVLIEQAPMREKIPGIQSSGCHVPAFKRIDQRT